MSGLIIPLHDDDHLEARSLLPWYLTGRLDGAEGALVEAHLAACAECRADLAFDRRLAAEVAALPIDVEQGWTRLRGKLAASAPRRPRGASLVGRPRKDWRGAWRGVARGWRGAPQLAWAVAAQAALLLLIVGALALPRGGHDRYRTLGAARAAASGNALVMFRPDTPERDLRAALQASHARLVDGPTAAGAYVIAAPPAGRAAALAKLRARADIVMAEPIDAGGPV